VLQCCKLANTCFKKGTASLQNSLPCFKNATVCGWVALICVKSIVVSFERGDIFCRFMTDINKLV